MEKFDGATNPAEADAGTIRTKYGTDISMNATHGSDSNENAEIEINFFSKFYVEILIILFLVQHYFLKYKQKVGLIMLLKKQRRNI